MTHYRNFKSPIPLIFRFILLFGFILSALCSDTYPLLIWSDLAVSHPQEYRQPVPNSLVLPIFRETAKAAGIVNIFLIAKSGLTTLEFK